MPAIDRSLSLIAGRKRQLREATLKAGGLQEEDVSSPNSDACRLQSDEFLLKHNDSYTRRRRRRRYLIKLMNSVYQK